MKQITKLIKMSLIITLTLLLSSCTTESGIFWLINHLSNPATPAPIENTFSMNITDITGDPGFILNALANQEEISLYTVVLDVTNPAGGTLAQIREFSGNRTGRVVFRMTQAQDSNTQGTFSIDRNTNILSFKFNFNGVAFAGKTKITQAQMINKTIYVHSDVKGDTLNSAPKAQISYANQSIGPSEALSIALDGSASTDSEGDLLAYSWSLQAPVGSTAVLNDSSTIAPIFTADIPGDYVVSLVVNDGQMQSPVVSKVITVAKANDVAKDLVINAIAKIQDLPLVNEAGSQNFVKGNKNSVLTRLEIVYNLIDRGNSKTAQSMLEQLRNQTGGDAAQLIEEMLESISKIMSDSNNSKQVMLSIVE